MRISDVYDIFFSYKLEEDCLSRQFYIYSQIVKLLKGCIQYMPKISDHYHTFFLVSSLTTYILPFFNAVHI